MEIFEWTDAYSVGDALMDAHHRVFFRLAKKFSEFPERGGREAIKLRIAFLVEYVAMHLGAEEALMREVGYPDYERHKALHDAFARKVLSARDSFGNDSASITAEEILRIMQEWLSHHIRVEDKQYASYLSK